MPNGFPEWTCHVAFLPVKYKNSSQLLGFLAVFNFSHSNRYRVGCHRGFIFHFPDDRWCRISFYVLIYVYILFDKVPLPPFISWIVSVLTL